MEQHTVTRSYLANFANSDGHLWKYPKTPGERPGKVSIRKATTEAHFYSLPTPEGGWDISIERILSSIEAGAAIAIARLRGGEWISERDRGALVAFAATNMVRGRWWRDFVLGVQRAYLTREVALSIADNDPKIRAMFSDDAIAELKERIRAGHLDGKPNERLFLKTLVTKAPRWADDMMPMSLTVYTPPRGRYFVTSDNPTFARFPHNVECTSVARVGQKGVEVGLPLGTDAFAVFTWGDLPEGFIKASARRWEHLNRCTVLSAHEGVFGPPRDRWAEAEVERYRHFRVLPRVSPRLESDDSEGG